MQFSKKLQRILIPFLLPPPPPQSPPLQPPPPPPPRPPPPKIMGIISSLPSSPLFSSIVTLYLLILLYFPQFFLKITVSPLLISTLILLLSLLRLGASQQIKAQPSPKREPEPIRVDPRPIQKEEEAGPLCNRSESGPEECPTGTRSGPVQLTFLEWDVSAPLEVIYEAYEGDENGEESLNDEFQDNNTKRIERYPSLSKYYPESDSDSFCSSSDGEFPAIERWDEDEREGLIEIALDQDHDDNKGMMIMMKLRELDQVDEEDNLIEIDISPF